MQEKTDFYLDITSDLCPMTFVRTKLLIERISAGQTVTIRLKGKEPLTNVPRSIRELGHDILDLWPEDGEDTYGIHKMIIRKSS